MNEQLQRELTIAMNIMYDIETDLLVKVDNCKKRIQELNDEYSKRRGGDPQKGAQTFAIVLIVISIFGLIVGLNDTPQMRESAALRAAIGIGTLILMIILIVLNLIRIKISQEHKKHKADSWWEKIAQKEVVELRREIEDNNYIISGLISSNPILADMPSKILSGLTVYQLKTIVEQGRAHTLSAAYDVWFNEQEIRRYREDMQDNLERIQYNQRELQSEIEKTNQKLDYIAFQEEMHYWEHRK